MMKKKMKMLIMGGMLALTAMPVKAQKWEGLADTPQMGWSTWNKFQGNISEDVIRGIADVMAESGLRDAGYTYINIDDCWHGKRDANGFIQADAKKFPNGMKALADYVHSKGLKLGIYSDATRNIIMNKDMIAIDQDTLGIQGLHYCDRDGLQFWFKPLAGGDWAFTILNPTRQDISCCLNWQDFNLTDHEVSKLSTLFDSKVYKVYNLWSHKFEGKTTLKNKVERKLVVKSRDVVSYRLINSK